MTELRSDCFDLRTELQNPQSNINLYSMKHQESVQILLADDDEDDTFLFQEALSQILVPTYLIKTQNGSELIKKLMGGDATPDLIFLDMNMPVKNGLECLAEIRDNQSFASTPVVILSTSIAQNLIYSAFRGGANLYIQKPTSFLNLISAIENCIVKRGEFTHKPKLEHFLIKSDSNQ